MRPPLRQHVSATMSVAAREAAGAAISIPAPQTRRRPVYVPSTSTQRTVDWRCLLRTGAHCIAQCRLDLGCYATCAPEALECF